MDKLLLEVRHLSLKLLLLCACSCKLGPESIKITLQLLLLCGSVGFQLLLLLCHRFLVGCLCLFPFLLQRGLHLLDGGFSLADTRVKGSVFLQR